MKLSVILAMASIVSHSLLGGEAWPSVPYSEIRAYAWPPELDTWNVIQGDKTFYKGVLNKDGARLSDAQLRKLLSAVNGEHPEHPVAGCQIYHNAIVAFNDKKEIVAYLQISFLCLYYMSEPKKTSKYWDILALAELFDELKLPLGKYKNVDEFKKSNTWWQKK